jgi:hypothetical protein
MWPFSTLAVYKWCKFLLINFPYEWRLFYFSGSRDEELLNERNIIPMDRNKKIVVNNFSSLSKVNSMCKISFI